MALNVIIESIVDRGYSPTLREIQVACGLGSLTATRTVVRRLGQLGYVRSRPRAAWGLELTGLPAIDEPDESLGPLWVLEAIERVEYPYLCRAAALAPTRQSAAEWLHHVIDRTRQAEALDAALRRSTARGRVPAPHIQAVVAEIERRWEAGLQVAETWLDHIVRESCGAAALVDRGFVSATQPVRGLTGAMTEGNLSTCRAGLRFADREIARLGAECSDRARFEDELESATAAAHSLIASVDPLFDAAWPRVVATGASASGTATTSTLQEENRP